MKAIRTPFLLLSFAVCMEASATDAPAKAPVPVIFDTDITGDVDDVLALAMLHSLADRGACEIRAVTISKKNPLAAPFVDAVNTFYGRPDIPIGINPGAPARVSKFLGLAESRDGDALRYPRDIGVTKEPEDAVSLLRDTLSDAEDGSIALIQVGLATNVAQLLDSEEDRALIKRKVAHLSVMAGAFQTIQSNNRYIEANVRNGVASMKKLANRWPAEVPVIWSGFAVGKAVPFPRERVADAFDYVEHHPVKEAYLLHSGPDHDRPTWDLTSVLYSVFPERGYFELSPRGRVSVADDGFTAFSPARRNWGKPLDISEMPAAKKRDRYLLLSPLQAARVREALVQFVVQPPAQHRSHLGGAPLKLIFDTDMGNDVDDAMALAVIHALERRGDCDLLAVTSTKDHPKSAAFIDALNTFYGRPDIPIGAVRDGAKKELGKFNGLADNYPHDLRSGEEAPDAIDLLRETLASQPDGSVTIAQVGFFTNLARLLTSAPDTHSPLGGTELVAAKVKELVIMAGSFQTIRYGNTYREYNVHVDVPSAQSFSSAWPTPIVWSGFEIGIAAAYPWQSVMEDFEYCESHPVKEAYLAYVPQHPHDRPTWDLTAVLYATYPDQGYFGLSPHGSVTVSDVGETFFRPGKPGGGGKSRDRFLTMTPAQTERVREALVQLTSEPPYGGP